MRDIGPYQLFSVLGVILILVIGGVLILLDILLDTVISWLQVGRKAEYRRSQWILEGKLQLTMDMALISGTRG